MRLENIVEAEPFLLDTDTLSKAKKLALRYKLPELPVLDKEGRFKGVVKSKNLIKFYDKVNLDELLAKDFIQEGCEGEMLTLHKIKNLVLEKESWIYNLVDRAGKFKGLVRRMNLLSFFKLEIPLDKVLDFDFLLIDCGKSLKELVKLVEKSKPIMILKGNEPIDSFFPEEISLLAFASDYAKRKFNVIQKELLSSIRVLEPIHPRFPIERIIREKIVLKGNEAIKEAIQLMLGKKKAVIPVKSPLAVLKDVSILKFL